MTTIFFLKKAWVWLKHNWYVPVIIIYTIALYFIFNKKNEAVAVLETRSESYRKQIKAIEDIHQKEIEKRDKILNEYNKIVEDLEKKFKEDNRKLDNQVKKEVKKIVKEYQDRPDDLAKMLAEKYGLELL